MKVPVTEDDIFFACALALEKPIDEISSIMCEFEDSQRGPKMVFIVDLKNKSQLKMALKHNGEMCHAEWVYYYLEERGLWGWQKKTRN